MGSIAIWVRLLLFAFNLLCSRRVTGMVLFSLPVFSASITLTNAPAYYIDGSIGSNKEEQFYLVYINTWFISC